MRVGERAPRARLDDPDDFEPFEILGFEECRVGYEQQSGFFVEHSVCVAGEFDDFAAGPQPYPHTVLNVQLFTSTSHACPEESTESRPSVETGLASVGDVAFRRIHLAELVSEAARIPLG